MNLQTLFDAQRERSRQAAPATWPEGRDRLARVARLLDGHSAALAAAVQADFGVRGERLTEVADLFVLRAMLADWRRLGRAGRAHSACARRCT